MLRSLSTVVLRTPLRAEIASLLHVQAHGFVQTPSPTRPNSQLHTQPPRHFTESAGSARSFAGSVVADAQGPGIQKETEASTQQDIPGGLSYNPAPHPSLLAKEKGSSYLLMHPVYTKEYVESVKPSHRPPQGFIDHAAFYTVQTARGAYDLVTGYDHRKMTKAKWLNRVLFLETIAGVPGMVGGMIRHLHSLRLMRRDYGWIHTLLEEAENERMHLLTFLQLKDPGIFFRSMVLGAQGVFCNVFFLWYLISPTFCHRFVGYLEEEAVKTYTALIADIEAGKIPEWSDADAPPIAKHYWRLDDDAKMRDLILAVRADEACHSHVNHTFAGMKKDQINPFSSGNHQVP